MLVVGVPVRWSDLFEPSSEARVRSKVAIGVIVLLTSSCAKSPPVVVPPGDASPYGRTTLRVLSQPAAPVKQDQGETRLVPVAPGPENRLPVYPADALMADCGDGAVAVRVYIGALGRVIRQTPVPGWAAVEGSCHTAFSNEVAGTVQQWGFFPALRQTCVAGQGAEPSCASEPIESYVDLEFLFEVVDGRPMVRPR